MAKKQAKGFKSAAAAKKGPSKKELAEKAKRIEKSHKVSGFYDIKASFVRGGAVRSK